MDYTNKNCNYYSNPRNELLEIINRVDIKKNILEIGSGFGSLGKSILKISPDSRIDAIEINDEARDLLIHAGYTNVWIGDAVKVIDSKILSDKYELVILPDVLEHIADDEKLLNKIRILLKSKGHLLISVPNVSNWQLIRNIYFHKSFKRDTSGIFDSTHLRWYTKNDIIELCKKNNFELIQYQSNADKLPGLKGKILSFFLGLINNELLISQHILLLRSA
jgi:2-polyprenyl-3-methyl-5-hydroxy-6-metoxy-1,4-benzoquinol methylase